LLGAVVRIPGLGYIVNDAGVARAILMQSDDFTKTGPGSAGAVITQVMGATALLNMDGAEHRALRTRLIDLFTSEYVDRLSKDVLDDAVAALRRNLVAGREVDLVHFVHLLTGRLMSYMLGARPPAGVEERSYADIFTLGAQLISVMRLSTTRLSRSQARRARAQFEQLIATAHASYKRLDTSTGDHEGSLIGRMRQMGLSFDEMKGVIGVLLLVGTETVSTALPRIAALLVDTGQLTKLRDHPELLPLAIDEGLRCTVPTPIMVRSVEETRTVEGHRFMKGGRVLIFTYNALKDGRYAPRPRMFDIERIQDPMIRNLWFGAGPHFCLGYGLAQGEIRAVLQGLVDLPHELNIARRRYARGVFLPSYARLDIVCR